MPNIQKALQQYLERQRGAPAIAVRRAFQELQAAVHHELSKGKADPKALRTLLAAKLDEEMIESLFVIDLGDNDEDDENYSSD